MQREFGFAFNKFLICLRAVFCNQIYILEIELRSKLSKIIRIQLGTAVMLIGGQICLVKPTVI